MDILMNVVWTLRCGKIIIMLRYNQWEILMR